MMIETPLELTLLAASVVLLIAQVMLQGATAAREFGGSYAAGTRDERRLVQSKRAGRAERALRNLLETYPGFVALALMLAITGRTGGLGAAGAAVWLGARLVYVPAYMLGVSFLRSLAWATSLAGLVLMLTRFFTFTPAL